MRPPDSATASASDGASDAVARIAAFARTASFETTRLTAGELEQVKQVTARDRAIYVSAIPSKPLSDQIEVAKSVHDAGFEAVPHLAARNFLSIDALDEHLRWLVEQAGVRRALVIAGDRPAPAGPLPDAVALIKSGILQRNGVDEIGISAYPDGHPRISDGELDRAMTDKLAAAETAGLRVRIVTQFTMSTEPAVELVARLRRRGINNNISIGLAGPTSVTTLLKFARVCGVKASTQGLARNIGLVKNLIGASTADPIVRALADLRDQLGDITPHFFSFGGLPSTTRWAGAVAAGRISLTKDGFEVITRQ